MLIRFLTASALATLLAPSAFAACQDEISNLDQAVIAAETGAQTGDAAEATEHQEQVLGGEQKADTADVGDVGGGHAPPEAGAEVNPGRGPHQSHDFADRSARQC